MAAWSIRTSGRLIRTELLDPIHVDQDPERVNDRDYVDDPHICNGEDWISRVNGLA